jgi:peptidoglycan/xylan/chitin deacetylase (PgdA/CDA1 family)
MKSSGREICLTFDDGPDPVTTEKILRILDRHGIKAIFFCTGEKASRLPELMTSIRTAGHLTGNHGYLHHDGFRTSSEKYLKDVMDAVPFTSGSLFRPPYGRMRPSQYRRLSKQFRIIMWDLMAYDFDREFASARSLETLSKMIRPGSLVALHDKAAATAADFLEEFITYSLSAGYRFRLPDGL